MAQTKEVDPATKIKVPDSIEMGALLGQALEVIGKLGTEISDVPPETVEQLRSLVTRLDTAAFDASRQSDLLATVSESLSVIQDGVDSIVRAFDRLANKGKSSPARPAKRSTRRRY